MYYRGWEIHRNYRGLWQAKQKLSGITMNTNTLDGLKTMIDQKILTQRNGKVM